MLTDGAAVEQVTAGPTGALSMLSSGTIWIQMSTVGVESCDRLADLAARHGVVFVDAPILSRGGLGPALKTLARRSTVPVVLHFGLDQRLPEAAEVAAYYVVSEAITNTAKHAQASEVNVSVEADRGTCCSRFETTELGEPTAPKAQDSSASETASRRSGATWRSRVSPEAARH